MRQHDLVITREEYQTQVAAYRRKSKCEDKKKVLLQFWYSVVYPKAKELWKSQTVMEMQPEIEMFSYTFSPDVTINIPFLPNHIIRKRDILTLR